MTNLNKRMPVIFIGHGSPMNAIEKTIFSEGMEAVGRRLPKPKSVLCISAHWETRGTFVTAMENPETIHDFGGFPHELYEVEYPAPGNPELAKRISSLVKTTQVELNKDWGLDHGCWSVLKYLFPKADIPIVELSMDYTKPASFHYALAKELIPLRDEGVLIVASGNIIHNLRLIDWRNLSVPDTGYDWAVKVHLDILQKVKEGNHQSLLGYDNLEREYRMAVPAPDHYLPLLYVLALQNQEDKLEVFNESIVGGSLDMTSLLLE